MSDRTSWTDGYGAVTYTADALGIAAEDKDAEVGALASKTESVIEQWEALDVDQRRAKRAEGRANALVRRRDGEADTLVTAIGNDALHFAKQDRKHPVFVRLFPNTVSAVARLGLESELDELKRIAACLQEPGMPETLKEAHAKPLAAVIKKGTAAIQVRKDAIAASGLVAVRVAAWRDAANNVLLGVEGSLKSIASERKLDTGWVDTFFPEATRTPGKRGTKPPVAAPAAS